MELNEIEGLITQDEHNEKNNDGDMWRGLILIEEDGWFEGIVNNLFSDKYKGDRLVFGVCHKGVGIEFIKVSPSGVKDPLIYSGREKNSEYNSDYCSLGISDIHGKTKVFINKIDYFLNNGKERDIQTEINELKEKISNFKNNNDNKIGLIYRSVLNNRTNLSYQLLYNNSDDSYLCSKAINDNRYNSKKLVKNLNRTLFEDDLK